MPIVYDFEKEDFINNNNPFSGIQHKKKRQGNGFANLLPAASNFLSDNKDLISNIGTTASAIGEIAGTSKKIADAVKEINNLKEIRKINIEKKTKPVVDKQKILDILNKNDQDDKTGNGFSKFSV